MTKINPLQARRLQQVAPTIKAAKQALDGIEQALNALKELGIDIDEMPVDVDEQEGGNDGSPRIAGSLPRGN